MRWALNGSPGTLLDPSFGGCAFLRVGLIELEKLGAPEAPRLVFGTDIDTATNAWADELVSIGVPRSHLRTDDFLTLRPGVELPRVDAVVGNPPYVRHHWLSRATTGAAVTAAQQADVLLGGKANLWAYFVVHATQFVRIGGRLGFLLPGSVITADYAAPVRDYLRRSFGSVTLVRVRDRLFPDAAEETVVLLADDRGHSCDVVNVIDVDDLAGLEDHLSVRNVTLNASLSDGVDWPSGALRLLDDAGQEIFRSIVRHPSVCALDTIASIRLGTVTGANSFFLCSEAEAAHLGMREYVVPTVARSAWLETTSFSESHLRDLAEQSKSSQMLVVPTDYVLDRRTRFGRRVTHAEAQGIHRRHHTRRSPWWALREPKRPDAFLPYMSGAFKGIVRNASGATSTNTIHQLHWAPTLARTARGSAVLSSWSTLTALTAEMYGRPSGGGLLKLEISDARKLLVLRDTGVTPELRSNSTSDDTRSHADEYISRILGLSGADMSILGSNLVRLASRRQPRTRARRPEEEG